MRKQEIENYRPSITLSPWTSQSTGTAFSFFIYQKQLAVAFKRYQQVIRLIVSRLPSLSIGVR